jgi:hypothetical protein
MARKLLPPEQATSLEEFTQRANREWAHCNNPGVTLRALAAGVTGMLMVVISFVSLLYVIDVQDVWQNWAGLVLPLVVLVFLLRRAWRNGRRDGARMRELDQLKREWQARAERGEIPRTRAQAEGITS